MRNFLQNLLIFFSLCLCGLIAFQWVRETDLRKNVQGLTDTVHNRDEKIQTQNGTIKRHEAEIQRLDTLKNELNNTIKTNNERILLLTKDLDKAEKQMARDAKQIESLTNNLAQANENIMTQNETIKMLNEDRKKLAEDRNETVLKFNKLADEFKELGERWNAQQALIRASNTNAPAKK